MQKLTKKLVSHRLNFLLVTIFALAFFLRFAGLNFFPPSLNWDEVSHGYNAYSILKTGKDEWGFSLPSIFRAYGDYKLPVYIYLTAISEYFLGLNEIAVRFPSVLAGTLSVLFTYLLVTEVTKNKTYGLISAFLLAVEPWGLLLSRAAVEANLSVFFVISGVYFFARGLKNPKLLTLSSMLLGLSVWTYNSARIFVPILIAVLVILYRGKLVVFFQNNKKFAIYSFLVLVIFFTPMFYQLLNQRGLARYHWVSIIDEGAVSQINQERTSSVLPGFLPVLIHNKRVFFVKTFIGNYFSHFSPDFLFFKGGSHYQFSVPGFGLLYAINLPFFLIGFVVLALTAKNKHFPRLIVSWFLFAPIASSLTRESPHVLRSIVFIPTTQIITSIGIVSLYNFTKEKWQKSSLLLVSFYGVIILAQIIDYGKYALFNYRRDYSWAWQYGYKQVIQYARENYKNYDKIVITKKYGEPHEFLLFYWPWNPADYRNDTNLVRFFQSNWYWVDSFDKFYFVNDWEIPKEKGVFVLESKKEVIDCTGKTKCLLITSPGNYPVGWKNLKTVNFLDGAPAFKIYEN